MQKNLFTQTLSTVLSAVVLVSSSMPSAHAAFPAAAGTPDFISKLNIPAQAGFIESSYTGHSKYPVILIQDLHANYGVQKNIVKILESVAGSSGPSTVVGVEAAWGDLDATPLRRGSLKARQKVGDVLLKGAEFTATDYFASTHKDPVQLVGIDDKGDYGINLDLFRNSYVDRIRLARKAEIFDGLLDKSRQQATRELKSLWRLEASYHQGKVELPELSRKLGMTLTTYGQAEIALRNTKLAIAAKAGDKAFALRNLVKADQNLKIIQRLLNQQLTLEEVQFVADNLSEILVTIKTLSPGENVQEWRRALGAAIDFYSIALMRNRPLSKNIVNLSERFPSQPVVAVAGGFHTEGITEELRNQQISYVVVAPVVAAHTPKDEALYVRRLAGLRMSDQEFFSGLGFSPKKSTMSPEQGVTDPKTVQRQAEGVEDTDTANFRVPTNDKVDGSITATLSLSVTADDGITVQGATGILSPEQITELQTGVLAGVVASAKKTTAELAKALNGNSIQVVFAPATYKATTGWIGGVPYMVFSDSVLRGSPEELGFLAAQEIRKVAWPNLNGDKTSPRTFVNSVIALGLPRVMTVLKGEDYKNTEVSNALMSLNIPENATHEEASQIILANRKPLEAAVKRQNRLPPVSQATFASIINNLPFEGRPQAPQAKQGFFSAKIAAGRAYIAYNANQKQLLDETRQRAFSGAA